jgi:hypothetical protein
LEFAEKIVLAELMRRIETDPVFRAVNEAMPDMEDVLAAEAYIEASGGNFQLLRDRIAAGSATRCFDRAAVAEVFISSPRRRDAILARLLPRKNRQRAELLDGVFGVGSQISPASLARAMAPYRRVGKREGSWVTVAERSTIATEYERLRALGIKSDDAFERAANAGRLHLGDRVARAAVTASRKRRFPLTRAERLRALKVVGSYRRALEGAKLQST